jgi:hypothetical protein
LNRRPKGDIQNIRQWAKPRGRVDILDVPFVFSSPAKSVAANSRMATAYSGMCCIASSAKRPTGRIDETALTVKEVVYFS